jgi:2-polyprenyl-6-hydroxyphenyl methylase/3-demethylubiquinone-9 3-methyltransferase
VRGKSFLDIGSGSGIHSLAAHRLGASRILSFDYDADSVECTRTLKNRFAPEADWRIEQGSALDPGYIKSLGKFDIVYSWGVLHHTGDMWRSLDLITIPANDQLMISIYNDCGITSKLWKAFKRSYNSQGPMIQKAMHGFVFVTAWDYILSGIPLKQDGFGEITLCSEECRHGTIFMIGLADIRLKLLNQTRSFLFLKNAALNLKN